jgi:hypothetical protein
MCTNAKTIVNEGEYMLREKVRNLEDYKTMKEKRFNEMIAKLAFSL